MYVCSVENKNKNLLHFSSSGQNCSCNLKLWQGLRQSLPQFSWLEMQFFPLLVKCISAVEKKEKKFCSCKGASITCGHCHSSRLQLQFCPQLAKCMSAVAKQKTFAAVNVQFPVIALLFVAAANNRRKLYTAARSTFNSHKPASGF